MGENKTREFDPSAMDHFFDSIDLIFDNKQGVYKNASLYDGKNRETKFITVTDARNADVESLLVIIEATHDGKTENFTEYIGEKMRKSTPTWTSPHNKPVLKHHNSYSGDPIGRVIKAEYGDSVTNPDSKTIFLTMEITEEDAIDKFLDGRFSTVSIGARVKELTCQICDRQILKEGFCGHWLGEKYKKVTKTPAGKDKEEMVTCYWTIGECTYYEVSVVNTPADKKQTGPLQMIKKTADGSASDSADNSPGKDSSAGIDEIADFLDSAGNQTQSSGSEDTDAQNKDEGDEQNADSDADGEEPGDEENADSEATGPEEGAGQENIKKIKELEEEANRLKTDNELLATTNAALQIENEKLSAENKELKDSNEVLTKQLSTRTNQTLSLGRQLKEIMKNTIATLGRQKIDDAVYAEKTILDIKKEFDGIVNRVSTAVPPVSPPGLVNNNAAGVDPESRTIVLGASNAPNKKKTVQEYADAIIEKKKTRSE